MASMGFGADSVSTSLDRRMFSRLAASFAVGWTLTGRSQAVAGDLSQTNCPPPLYPLSHGGPDGFAALMAYDPEKDQDAAYFRSRVPLATRCAPFAPTQAHPALDPRPRAASLSTAYGPLDERLGDAFSRMRYGESPSGKLNISRMLAYNDVVVGWGGTGMIPNPAMTDAAHRNGALCLGTIFQPDARLYNSSAAPASAVAAKLLSLARYFGFDGYFVNFEGGDARGREQVLDLIALMREQSGQDGGAELYIQFYDGQTAIGELLPPRHPGSKVASTDSAANSVMLDQGWSAYGGPGNCCSGRARDPKDIYDYCRRNGFDPYATTYFGLQLYPGPGYLGAAAPQVIAPNGSGPAYGGLQLYSADDGLRTMLRVHRSRTRGAQSHSTADTAAAERRALYALERMLFSGASENPALDNHPDAVQARAYAATDGRHLYTDYQGGEPRPTDQVNLPMTFGVANFIVERSAIGTAPFVSRFNTGEGDSFFIDGARVNNRPWFNMGIQDVLPTWQWRREPFDGQPDRAGPQPSLLAVDYDFDDAFNGGCSLRISGLLGPTNGMRLWLFKTALRLDPTGGEILRLVFKGAPPSDVAAKVGLIFEDAPQAPEWIAFEADTAAPHALTNGWSRSSISLAPYAGRTLAAILLGFTLDDRRHEPAEIALNIGEIYVGAGAPSAAPPAPTGLVLQASKFAADGRSAQARLAWDYADGMAYYDIFGGPHDQPGDRVWLGRINGDRYYVSDAPLSGARETWLEVVAVRCDAPLSPSSPSRIRLSQPASPACATCTG